MPHAAPRRPALGLTSLLALAIVLAALPPRPSYAAPVVTTLADDNSAGSLRQAIAAAVSGDTITFAQGISGTIVLTQGTLVINKSITISGPSENLLAVSGNDSSRVFEIMSGRTVTISDLRITGGRSSTAAGVGNHGDLELLRVSVTGNTVLNGSGGGIYNAANAAGLRLISSSVSNNRADGGGGILNESRMTIVDSSIVGNTATGFGGGVANLETGTLAITNTSVLSNSATLDGGGIYNLSGGALTISGGEIAFNSGAQGGGIGSLGRATLTGTVLHDNSANNGAGIYQATAGARTSLDGVTLRANTVTGSGGGIFSRDEGLVTIQSSFLLENTADAGGGMAGLGASVLVTRTLLADNTASSFGGGGAYANGGSFTFTESTFRDNDAPLKNGGAINASGAVTVRASLVHGNTADTGGGVFVDGDLFVENSTLSGNRSTGPNSGGGGGIMLFGGTANLVNATVTANSTTFSDGAGGVEQVGGALIFSNSLIAANIAASHPDCKGSVTSQGYNLIGTLGLAGGGCGAGLASTDRAGPTLSAAIDPQLGALSDNGGPTLTHALLPGSPALNAGSPQPASAQGCPVVDQRGVARPQGGRCDIGAVEMQVGQPVQVVQMGIANTNVEIVDDLADLEGTTAEINSLGVQFSAPMGPSAALASSYRLIGAGPDSVVDTASCAATKGDDVLFSIGTPTYNTTTRTAAFVVNGLPPGRYRLLACPSLAGADGGPLVGEATADGAVSRRFEVLAAAQPPWLVLLYFAGEDLVDIGYEGIADEMALALNRLRGNPAARIVALYDGRGAADTRLYTFEGGARLDVTESAASSLAWTGGFGGVPGARELNTGSALTLQNFITWAKATYPGARHTFLSVVDHGGGWAPDLGPGAQPGGGTRVLAGGWRGLSLDVRSASSLSTRETGAVFGAPGTATHVDVLFYDACLMGMLETAYEVRDGADYLVAAENLLFADFPYERYLAPERLRARTTPRELAEGLVARYNAFRLTPEPFTIAAIDTTRLRGTGAGSAAGRLEQLAKLLLAGLPEGPVPLDHPLRAALYQAYAASQKFDYDNSLAIDPREGYVDLGDFLGRLAASPSAAVSPEQRAAAAALRELLVGGAGRAVIARRTVSGRYEGRLWQLDGATGLSIFLPLGEQDWRPTRINLGGADPRALLPEDQLAYYAAPDQLDLTRDAPSWAALLLRLQGNTPIRAPGGLPAGALAADQVVYSDPFRSALPAAVPFEVRLPVLRR